MVLNSHKVIHNKTSFFPKLLTQNTWMYTANGISTQYAFLRAGQTGDTCSAALLLNIFLQLIAYPFPSQHKGSYLCVKSH